MTKLTKTFLSGVGRKIPNLRSVRYLEVPENIRAMSPQNHLAVDTVIHNVHKPRISISPEALIGDNVVHHPHTAVFNAGVIEFGDLTPKIGAFIYDDVDIGGPVLYSILGIRVYNQETRYSFECIKTDRTTQVWHAPESELIAPTIWGQKVSGKATDDKTTNQTGLVFYGWSLPGTEILFCQGTTVLATVVVQESGHWETPSLGPYGDGSYTFTAKARRDGQLSPDSAPYSITVAGSGLDTTAPTGAMQQFSGTTSSPVNTVSITFSEAITGFAIGDLVLSRDNGANLLPGAATLTTSNGGISWTLNGLAGLTNANGTYSLSLISGHGIQDAGGNALSNNPSTGFTIAGFTLPDTTPPSASLTQFTGVQVSAVFEVLLTFDEPITGLSTSGFTLTSSTSSDPNLIDNIPGGLNITDRTGEGRFFSLSSFLSVQSSAAQYTLAFNGANATVYDVAGNRCLSEVSTTWNYQPVTIIPVARMPQVGDVGTWVGIGNHSFTSSTTQAENIKHLFSVRTSVTGNVKNNPANPWSGVAASLGAGEINVRDSYANSITAINNARAAKGYPATVNGIYTSAHTLISLAEANSYGQWPVHSFATADFQSTSHTVPPPQASIWNAERWLDYTSASARADMKTVFLKFIKGELHTPKFPIVHFDEVGVLADIWAGEVDVFSYLRSRANDAGVLLSVNFGGWNMYSGAPVFAPNIINEMAAMTNFLHLELAPDRSDQITQTSLEGMISTWRSFLGLATPNNPKGIELPGYPHPRTVGSRSIATVTEVTTGGVPVPTTTSIPGGSVGDMKLLVTFTTPMESLKAMSAAPWESVDLGIRPTHGSNITGVPVTGWSIWPAASDGSSAYLFRRGTNWNATKATILAANPGFTLANLVGQPVFNYSAGRRMQAAVCLIAADNINESWSYHYSPQGYRPDTLANWLLNQDLNFFKWGQRLGNPVGSRVWQTTSTPNLQRVYRDYTGGRLTIDFEKDEVIVAFNA